MPPFLPPVVVVVRERLLFGGETCPLEVRVTVQVDSPRRNTGGEFLGRFLFDVFVVEHGGGSHLVRVFVCLFSRQ